MRAPHVGLLLATVEAGDDLTGLDRAAGLDEALQDPPAGAEGKVVDDGGRDDARERDLRREGHDPHRLDCHDRRQPRGLLRGDRRCEDGKEDRRERGGRNMHLAGSG